MDKRQGGCGIEGEIGDLFNFEVFELTYVKSKKINKIYMKLHNKNDGKDTGN